MIWERVFGGSFIGRPCHSCKRQRNVRRWAEVPAQRSIMLSIVSLLIPKQFIPLSASVCTNDATTVDNRLAWPMGSGRDRPPISQSPSPTEFPLLLLSSSVRTPHSHLSLSSFSPHCTTSYPHRCSCKPSRGKESSTTWHLTTSQRSI